MDQHLFGVNLFNGYGFCKVSWLIHVVSAEDGNMICQKLKSNGHTKSTETIVYIRNLNQVIVASFIAAHVFVCYHDHMSAAGFYFFPETGFLMFLCKRENLIFFPRDHSCSKTRLSTSGCLAGALCTNVSPAAGKSRVFFPRKAKKIRSRQGYPHTCRPSLCQSGQNGLFAFGAFLSYNRYRRKKGGGCLQWIKPTR